MNGHRMHRIGLIVMGLFLLLFFIATLFVWANVASDDALSDHGQHPSRPVSKAMISKGAYLAKVGNCAACHTARGGADMAGGKAIDTPFGTLFTPNLTPDATSGIGAWSADDFWRAMHHGKSKDGRLLYPAFPYPNYTFVTREDSDAIFAYLQSLPAVNRVNQPHALRFPYNQQAALAVWRTLYFWPASHQPEPAQSVQWNRGRYLVRGLGHCVACHGSRNALGAITNEVDLGGGLIPMQDWYAPSLASSAEAGVAHWRTEDVVALLRTGVAPQASVQGPMAEVVYRSTQYLTPEDLQAMAVYLKALPQKPTAQGRDIEPTDPQTMQLGGRLYSQHCATCHGDSGEGVAGIYPALAGNRAVMLPWANNLVKTIVHGGFAPATAGNPRPFGMPPFGQALNDREIAAVATYVRQAWGNKASSVSSLDVYRMRPF